MNQALLPGYLNFLMAWYNVRKLPKYQIVQTEKEPSEVEWEKLQDEVYPYKPITINPSLLLEIFNNECLPIIKQNLQSYQRQEFEIEKVLNQLLDKLLELIWSSDAPKEIKEKEAKDAEKLFYRRPLEILQNHQRRLSHLLKMNDWKRKPAGNNEITDSDIARAKEFSLKEFIAVNHAGFAHCPFHNEKTPSFKIFKDNRYHCFSCGVDGDVIDFIMKRDGIDFILAVKKLLNK